MLANLLWKPIHPFRLSWISCRVINLQIIFTFHQISFPPQIRASGSLLLFFIAKPSQAKSRAKSAKALLKLPTNSKAAQDFEQLENILQSNGNASNASFLFLIFDEVLVFF